MGYESLARALTGLWKPEWEGALMVALTYTTGEGNQESCQASCSGRGRKLLLSAKGDHGSRLDMVLLLPPHKKPGASQDALPSGLIPWKTFSPEEIRAAALHVGDHNGIHQGDRPIAGGFLLMEAMAARYVGHKRYKIRFYAPIYAGEAVSLIEDGGSALAYAGGHLCFRCNWEDA